MIDVLITPQLSFAHNGFSSPLLSRLTACAATTSVLGEQSLGEAAVTEPNGAEGRSADRRTHNELSGRAHTAAMARTVYGGIHVHHPRRWKPSKVRPSDRLVVSGVMIVITVASVVVQAAVRAQDNDQTASRPGSGSRGVAVATAPASELDPDRQDPDTSPTFDLDIPPRLNAALLQSYRCRGTIRPHAAAVFLEIKKNFDIVSLARDYAERSVELYWEIDARIHSSWVLDVERSAVDSGRIYRGVELSVDITSMTRDPCVGTEGYLKALILDGGEVYLLLLVMADLSGDSQKTELPTKQELDHLVDTARPRS